MENMIKRERVSFEEENWENSHNIPIVSRRQWERYSSWLKDCLVRSTRFVDRHVLAYPPDEGGY